MLTIRVLLAAAAPAGAGEPSKDARAWSGQAEVSFVNTTGNTDTTSLAGKNLLEYRFTPEVSGSWKIGGWNRDRFAGIDHRYYGGGGVGRKFLDGPKHFLAGAFSLKAGYTVRYDHKPVPAGLERTDAMASVALVANF